VCALRSILFSVRDRTGNRAETGMISSKNYLLFVPAHQTCLPNLCIALCTAHRYTFYHFDHGQSESALILYNGRAQESTNRTVSFLSVLRGEGASDKVTSRAGAWQAVTWLAAGSSRPDTILLLISNLTVKIGALKMSPELLRYLYERAAFSRHAGPVQNGFRTDFCEGMGTGR